MNIKEVYKKAEEYFGRPLTEFERNRLAYELKTEETLDRIVFENLYNFSLKYETNISKEQNERTNQ